MRKRHLRLIVSNCENDEKYWSLWERFKNFIECILLSQNEKIYMIKDCLINIYRDYEETTGEINIPYFVKADIRMSKIIKDKKVNYYYIRLKKFKNKKV